MSATSRTALELRLTSRELGAVRSLVWRILDEVPADLAHAALFGSRARGTAHPRSDVDTLLVFAELPPDREPHAGMAERIADDVARASGVPVTVWSVSLIDTLRGNRTPMLVDALADAIPVWSWPEPLGPVPFTPEDALHCVDALLRRVDEGSVEFAAHLREGAVSGAARRGRDDLVRLCTALLLLQGRTRPRRADPIAAVLESRAIYRLDAELLALFEWGRASFGPSGDDEARPVAPPADLGGLTRAMDLLRREVYGRARGLARTLGPSDPLPRGGR